MPVILAEIRRIPVQSQSRQIVHEILPQTNKQTNKQKNPGFSTWLVEWLKALSSNPSFAKKSEKLPYHRRC
jgi:hypothetical protein